MISKVGRKWILKSKAGKKLGEFDTKFEAMKTLRRIEYYKSVDKKNK